MKYKIALYKTAEGYSVSVPGLPGCWSQGSTETEALANIKDALIDYLAVVGEGLKDADVREVEVGVEWHYRLWRNDLGRMPWRPIFEMR